MPSYEEEIIAILTLAGTRGLPVHKIARHVYNSVNSLFEQVSYDEVYRHVRYLVAGRAHRPHALFTHAPRYGYYRLNRRSRRYKALFGDSD